MDRVQVEPRVRHRIGVALIAALSLVPIGGSWSLASSSRGLPARCRMWWESLTNTNGVVTETPGRLVDLSNSRPRYRREGLRVGEHKLLKGTGAGGFEDRAHALHQRRAGRRARPQLRGRDVCRLRLNRDVAEPSAADRLGDRYRADARGATQAWPAGCQ